MDCWRIRVDTGGTFTDCLAIAPDGAVHRAKVLSSSALRGRVRRRISKALQLMNGGYRDLLATS